MVAVGGLVLCEQNGGAAICDGSPARVCCPAGTVPAGWLGRLARILAALLLFSYAYYLYDAWVYWGLWPRMADLGTFLRLVWTQQITDSFWYLTFYLALLAMLPFLQRLASA